MGGNKNGSRLDRRSFLGMTVAGGTALAAGRARAAAVQDVPFFAGRSDLEATLACARMALSHYNRNEHYQLADVAEMVFHRGDFWVFESQLIPIFNQKNLGATLHATTPYRELARGKAAAFGPDAGARIDREALAWAAGYFNENTYREEAVPFEQVLEWRRLGAVMIVGVSRAALRGDAGLPYCRYNVVLTGEDGDNLVYHDPSAGPHCRAPRELLRRAYEGTPDRAVLGTLPHSG